MVEDSDDEAAMRMQTTMNYVYFGMFAMVAGIFVWQFYLASHRPEGVDLRDVEDL